MKIDGLAYLYIILVSLFPILIFPVVLEPLDNDVFYHMLVAREMIDQKTPIITHMPWFNAPYGIPHIYPPLFHWLFVLLSLGGLLDMEWIAIMLQIIFYPLALLAVYRLVSHVEGEETALISIILLTLYFPFFGRTHLAIPEALQHILIPLTFLAYLKGREKTCGILMALMLANHRYDALLIISAIIVHWILYKRKTYNIVNTLIVASLGFPFQIYGIMGPQIRLPLLSVPSGSHYINRMCLALISSSVMLLFGIWFLRRRLVNKGNIIFLIWFLFVIPIVLKYPGRFSAYAGTPLSVMTSILILKLRDEKKGFYDLHLPIIIVLLISSIYLSYYCFPYLHDFYRPGVDVHEKSFFSWMKENIPEEEIIQLDCGRSGYEGYRIAYLTRHRTTELDNISKYCLSIYIEPQEGNWTLIRGGPYRIYNKSSRGATSLKVLTG